MIIFLDSWKTVNSFFIIFSLENERSPVATVTGNVRNIRITMVRFEKDEDKLFLKIHSSILHCGNETNIKNNSMNVNVIYLG